MVSHETSIFSVAWPELRALRDGPVHLVLQREPVGEVEVALRLGSALQLFAAERNGCHSVLRIRGPQARVHCNVLLPPLLHWLREMVPRIVFTDPRPRTRPRGARPARSP